MVNVRSVSCTFTVWLRAVPPALGSAGQRGGEGLAEDVSFLAAELADGRVAEGRAQRSGTGHGALIRPGQLLALHH